MIDSEVVRFFMRVVFGLGIVAGCTSKGETLLNDFAPAAFLVLGSFGWYRFKNEGDHL